ncbi:hypothetical protein TrVE_jg12950 [Triparma verrucosa]|uniref:Uncharacterized protein n=1 Tax=Triparma verrucosa TaxID=1606542 RepID=A0A9W7BYV9_9STRA|nr:hypothetical protein TrVE_jg12950 [Triparma verrucosa]
MDETWTILSLLGVIDDEEMGIILHNIASSVAFMLAIMFALMFALMSYPFNNGADEHGVEPTGKFHFQALNKYEMRFVPEWKRSHTQFACFSVVHVPPSVRTPPQILERDVIVG